MVASIAYDVIVMVASKSRTSVGYPMQFGGGKVERPLRGQTIHHLIKEKLRLEEKKARKGNTTGEGEASERKTHTHTHTHSHTHTHTHTHARARGEHTANTTLTKDRSCATSDARCFSIISSASSSVREMFFSFHELGFLEPRCLHKI